MADVLLSRLGAQTRWGAPSWPRRRRVHWPSRNPATDLRILDQPLISLAETWTGADQHEGAREALEHLFGRAHDLGDESARPWLHFPGRRRARARQSRPRSRSCTRRPRGRRAVRTAVPGCERRARESGERRARPRRCSRQAARRALELGPRRAAHRLDCDRASGARAPLAGAGCRASRPASRSWGKGIVELGATRFVVDHVQALIELGRGDEAGELLDWYEGNARRLGRASALAASLRCRGLLAAQAGDLDGALTAFAQALEWHARVTLLLDRARTCSRSARPSAVRSSALRRGRRSRKPPPCSSASGRGLGRPRPRRARADQRPRAVGERTHTGRRACGLPRRRGADESGDRGRALPVAAHRRGAPLAHLRKLGVRRRGEVARGSPSVKHRRSRPSNSGETPVSAPPAAP